MNKLTPAQRIALEWLRRPWYAQWGIDKPRAGWPWQMRATTYRSLLERKLIVRVQVTPLQHVVHLTESGRAAIFKLSGGENETDTGVT